MCSVNAMSYLPITSPAVLFTGGQSTESIALWDLRARRTVYELATGNNGVDSLVWDAANSTLYASTVCGYVDAQGNSYGCRPFRPPKVQHATASKPTSRDEDYDMEDDDEYDDDDDDDYDQSWPKDAFHSEGHFGYDFDAGDHRLCTSASLDPSSALMTDKLFRSLSLQRRLQPRDPPEVWRRYVRTLVINIVVFAGTTWYFRKQNIVMKSCKH